MCPGPHANLSCGMALTGKEKRDGVWGELALSRSGLSGAMQGIKPGLGDDYEPET